MNRPNKEINEMQRRNKMYLDELRARATKAELKFKGVLDEIKVKYIFQKGFFGDRYHCIVDFYLPRPYKICIEIDGEYHSDKEQKIKDERKDRFLIGVRGFHVLRLKNKEVLNGEIESSFMRGYLDSEKYKEDWRKI